eukprot:PhF_6_TR13460/c0_g1_i1/m.21570
MIGLLKTYFEKTPDAHLSSFLRDESPQEDLFTLWSAIHNELGSDDDLLQFISAPGGECVFRHVCAFQAVYKYTGGDNSSNTKSGVVAAFETIRRISIIRAEFVKDITVDVAQSWLHVFGGVTEIEHIRAGLICLLTVLREDGKDDEDSKDDDEKKTLQYLTDVYVRDILWSKVAIVVSSAQRDCVSLMFEVISQLLAINFHHNQADRVLAVFGTSCTMNTIRTLALNAKKNVDGLSFILSSLTSCNDPESFEMRCKLFTTVDMVKLAALEIIEHHHHHTNPVGSSPYFHFADYINNITMEGEDSDMRCDIIRNGECVDLVCHALNVIASDRESYDNKTAATLLNALCNLTYNPTLTSNYHLSFENALIRDVLLATTTVNDMDDECIDAFAKCVTNLVLVTDTDAEKRSIPLFATATFRNALVAMSRSKY